MNFYNYCLLSVHMFKCTEKDVLSYFTQFGEVISVRKKWPTASVHFKDACSAYKALVQPEHQMRGSRIIVDYEEKCEQEVPTNPKSESPSNALTVLSLNDDCLGMICGLLDLRDQINFARVCLRFNDVFKIFCKRKYKAFDLLKMSSMTLCEIRDFFRFFGEYIEEVAINSENKNRNHITEFIGLFCKNLKRITIEDIELQPDALNKLLRSFPKLVELRLLRCYDMNDTTVKSLLHLKNLDTLLLNGCLITDESSQQLELSQSSIEGKFLSGLSQLKKLSLNNCENIKTKNLIKICKAMKNLKSLDMRDCAVTSDFFETMADHCLELEVLKMSFPDFSVDCVARLSCLKHLDLDCSESFGGRLLTTLLTELVAHKADQLESLKCLGSLTVDHFTAISELKQLKIFSNICSLCDDEALRKLSKLELLEELTIRNADDITNEALLGLLQNCTRLHILDIQCCQRISTQFIAEAIDILNKKMIKKF